MTFLLSFTTWIYARFKENLETKLTHEAPAIPEGKRIVNVAQKDGVVQTVFADDDTAKQDEVDEIKQHIADSGLSHNTEESTYVDENGGQVNLPPRTVMMKGFTHAPTPAPQTTRIRTGRFFIITEN